MRSYRLVRFVGRQLSWLIIFPSMFVTPTLFASEIQSCVSINDHNEKKACVLRQTARMKDLLNKKTAELDKKIAESRERQKRLEKRLEETCVELKKLDSSEECKGTGVGLAF